MPMAGAAMLGYWLTGSLRIDSAPASITTRAITQANTGRSMKNLDIKPSPADLRSPALSRLAGVGLSLQAWAGWTDL
ncbi:hypothetical protein D3C76_516620 [compost metagenome]